MDLWHLNIGSFHVVHNQVKQFCKKICYSQISKKHDQTSINLTNVFDFID